MENVIIIAVIAVIVFFAFISAVKHFKGQGGCCGGSDYRPKKKKLASVLYTKAFKVDGMHCSHCKNRVEEVVNDIDGVSGTVDLKKGELKVSYEKVVAEEIIITRIERAGYSVRL